MIVFFIWYMVKCFKSSKLKNFFWFNFLKEKFLFFDEIFHPHHFVISSYKLNERVEAYTSIRENIMDRGIIVIYSYKKRTLLSSLVSFLWIIFTWLILLKMLYKSIYNFYFINNHLPQLNVMNICQFKDKRDTNLLHKM